MNLQAFWLSCPSTGTQFGLYEGFTANSAILEFGQEWGLKQAASSVAACLVEDIAVGTALLLCRRDGSEFVLQVRGQAQRYRSASELGPALIAFFKRPLATLFSSANHASEQFPVRWRSSDYDMVFLSESLNDLSAQLEEARWAARDCSAPEFLLDAIDPAGSGLVTHSSTRGRSGASFPQPLV